MSKDDIIATAQYDLAGFNSIKDHLKDAQLKEKSIPIDDM